MAATVEIDESNDSTGEVVTDAISHSNYGAVDAAHLVLTVPANLITPGQNSREKWHRWHLVDLAGSAAIQTLKFWASASPPTAWTHFFNGHTSQVNYEAANHRQTSFAAPATSTTRTPETVPTSEPAGPNIGIGGVLLGQLSAPGRSDYLLHQVRTTTAVAVGFLLTLFYGYEDLA